MKLLVLMVCSALLINANPWLTDFELAKKNAKDSNQYILLTFSGSDWCGPCIRLHREVFDSNDFENLAKGNLVLVNADFPREKKNQLPKQQQQQNEKLADLYNPAGNFPSTVLLNADGKVLKVWDGFPKNGAAAFIDELKLFIHANR